MSSYWNKQTKKKGDQKKMNELQVFDSEEFGKIRTAEINGNIYFSASDVAKALGYSNPRDAVARHCKCVVKRDGVSNTTNQYGKTTKQPVMMSFIPEGDLYRLIVHSKLPSADRFERWVFDTVLPSIRKNGGYISGQENLSDEELMAKAILVAQRTIEEKNKVIAEQQQKIEEDRPKTIFADAVSASKSSILVGELSKLICQNGVHIGQNRLFQWLRDNHYLGRCGDRYNIPNQKYIEQGLFEIKKNTITNPNGSIRTTSTTKVTGKGQVYFVNKFLNEGVE